MSQYEYKVVPAPRKGLKTKDHKTPEDRFAYALQEVMNEHGGAGWEYLRAETLPSDERAGLTGKETIFRDVLVFRRPRAQAQDLVNPLEANYPLPDGPQLTAPAHADHDDTPDADTEIETDTHPDRASDNDAPPRTL